MNAWNGTCLTPLPSDPILVIGPDSPFQRALAREVESLPAIVRTAEAVKEATEIAF